MGLDTHQTVLLEEAVHALINKRNGSYVDCTYGRGGHSQAIADELAGEGGSARLGQAFAAGIFKQPLELVQLERVTGF